MIVVAEPRVDLLGVHTFGIGAQGEACARGRRAQNAAENGRSGKFRRAARKRQIACRLAAQFDRGGIEREFSAQPAVCDCTGREGESNRIAVAPDTLSAKRTGKRIRRAVHVDMGKRRRLRAGDAQRGVGQPKSGDRDRRCRRSGELQPCGIDGDIGASCSFAVMQTDQDGAAFIFAVGQYQDALAWQDERLIFKAKAVILDNSRVTTSMPIPL